jgi:hypothetical protein
MIKVKENKKKKRNIYPATNTNKKESTQSRYKCRILPSLFLLEIVKAYTLSRVKNLL